MREIKFRAFIKEDKILDKHLILNNIKTYEVASIDFESKIASLRLAGLMDFSFSQIELMQYTGVDSADGRKIYEGDIFTFSAPTWEDIAMVVYYDNEAGFRWMASEKDKDNIIKTYPLSDFLYREYEDVKIIGNIHQNPELLKDGNNAL